MTITNTASKLLLAVVLATSAALPASAQNPNPRVAEEREPRVMVPAPSPGGYGHGSGIRGCWTADRDLYGPYRLTFCIGGFTGDSYTVTGNGLNCQARLRWHPTLGGYAFAMSRARCGWGTDWTADRFTCVLKGGDWGDGRVAVPSHGSRLDCFYMPAAWGHFPTTFSAHRT